MKILNWIMVFLGIVGLVGIRVLEENLFYDPFLEFFNLANKNAAFPKFLWNPLIISHLFRFALNLIFSLTVVYFLFKKKDWTLQAAVMIVLVFLITFPLYLYCISTRFEIGYLFSFYLRRFVIQPLTVLLIIPLFYYRKSLENRS